MRWLKDNGWGLVGLPLLIYTLASLFMTWPLLTQLSTHVAGGGFGDSFEYVRLGWWGRYALQTGQNPFYQGLLAYPDGFFSATQTAQPLIYWPISLPGFLFSPVAAFNLWILLEIILSGLTAYWLCLYVLHHDISQPAQVIPALLGGLIFMAYPAVQGHLVTGHVNPLSNYALPVVALCLYRITEGRGGLRTALVGAVALLILALGNFTFPIFNLLPLLLFGGIYILLTKWRQVVRWRILGRLVLMLIGGGILLLPFYVPLIGEALAPNRPEYLQEGGHVRYSTDPLAFVALSPFTPWGERLAPPFSRTVLGTNATEGTAYLGLATVALALAAVRRRKQNGAMLWLAIALGSMVFALGPLLKWNDQPVTYTLNDPAGAYTGNIVLPWALFKDLPIINITRTPGRFNITVGLMLGVLAALGADDLQKRIGQRRLRIGIGLALGIFILFEYQLFFPFLTTPAAIPQYFYDLAGRNDIRAVLHVPFDDPIAQKEAMFFQIAHHKPLIAGYVSRRTPVDPAKLAVLGDMALFKAGALRAGLLPDALKPEEIRAALNLNGVDVLAYHWETFGEADKNAVYGQAVATFGAPRYQDSRIAVFEVHAEMPDLVAIPYTFASTGWHFDDFGAAGRFSWLQAQGDLYFYMPKAADQMWYVSVSPMLTARRLFISVDSEMLWAGQIQRNLNGAVYVELGLQLSPGFHTLRFTAPDGCTNTPVSPSCLMTDNEIMSGQIPRPRNMPFCQKPDTTICASIGIQWFRFQEAGEWAFRAQTVMLEKGMALEGFRAPKQAMRGFGLSVHTQWRAASKLDGDYHLFVHLLDKDGKLIDQDDIVPGNGAYPTTQWSAPQHWIQMSHLFLPPDLPKGTYSLYAGWYRYPDMTRLQVFGDGPRSGDGLVFLSDIEVP